MSEPVELIGNCTCGAQWPRGQFHCGMCHANAYSMEEMHAHWHLQSDGRYVCRPIPPRVFNYQLVRLRGEEVIVQAPLQVMTKHQALVHAAWLVAVADPLDEHFADILKAVEST